MEKNLQVGDTLTTLITGKVVDVGTGHGRCYEVEIPQEDFINPRKIWINHDDILQPNTELVNVLKRIVKANLKPSDLYIQFEKFQEECSEILKKYELSV